MKPTKVVLALCMTCCMLISCKEEKNEPNQPTPPSQTSMTEKAKEVATYLTDNYAVGDSVFFVTKTGDTEGFIVRQNYFLELIYTPEYDFGEPEPEPELTGYKLRTFLESPKDTFDILISVTKSLNGSIIIDGGITINREYDFSTNYTNMNEDSITLIIADKSCTLRKNVGLTRVQNNSSTWDLIQ